MSILFILKLIYTSKNLKFLRIIIDDKLNWKSQIIYPRNYLELWYFK